MSGRPRVLPGATPFCQLGCGSKVLELPPPPPHSSAPESPVEIEKVWPCATACWKIWSCAAAEPSLCALVSHSPSDTLMILVALALTMVLKSAVRLALDRVGIL